MPERAEYLRVITDELNRISSHCIALGAMAMDIGAITPFTYILREREYVNELLEMLCGARLTYNYHRIGGVGWDMPAGWRDKVLQWCDHFEPVIDEFDRLITQQRAVRAAAGESGGHQRGGGDRLRAGRARTCAPPASTSTCGATCPTRSIPS